MTSAEDLVTRVKYWKCPKCEYSIVKGDTSMTIDDWLGKFRVDMRQKFDDHDNKWGDVSVTRPEFNFNTQLADTEYLRQEITYHYAKLAYRSWFKTDLPEKDALTNLANMCLLLWIKLNIEGE